MMVDDHYYCNEHNAHSEECWCAKTKAVNYDDFCELCPSVEESDDANSKEVPSGVPGSSEHG